MNDFDTLTPADQDYEERSAIMEFEGGMPRAEAERKAAELVRARWGANAELSGERSESA